MPIDELTSEDVIHSCVACGATRRLALSALASGGNGQPVAPDVGGGGVLQLPACECGVVEFLMASPPGEPPHPSPGSLGHLHRLLVDALHAEVARRALAPGEGSEEGEGSRAPAVTADAELRAWFPQGLRMPRPRPPSSGTGAAREGQ